MELTLKNKVNDDTVFQSPWYAFSFSIILPGSGHIYAGKYIRGIAFILLYMLIEVLVVFSLLLDECRVSISIALGIFSLFFLPVFCCYDIYKKTKRPDVSYKTRRNIWISLFLAIIFPPLGYFYLKKWLDVAISTVLFTAVFIFTDFPGDFVLLTVLTCLHISFFIFRLGKKDKRLALGLIFFCFIIGYASDISYTVICTKKLFDIDYVGFGESMNPTLYTGDIVLADLYDSEVGNIDIDDIVLILPIKIDKQNQSSPLVKRVVGVGGEVIQIINGVVYIDGKATKRTRGVRGEVPNRKFYKYAVSEPYTIPEDCFFVLGDYQNNSYDSRMFGGISKDQIEAKITKILWPLARMGVIRK